MNKTLTTSNGATQPSDRYHAKIAAELTITKVQVEATALLLSQGATVPFISRYRKEATGSLDEIQIAAIRDRLAQLEELDKRREAIRKSLAERNLLTDELEEKITVAETLAVLDDIYLPFRPKRRTRATAAREKGLSPWPGAFLTRKRFSLLRLLLWPSWIRKREWPMSGRPWPGLGISSPSG